jgi:mRNA interferase MazF
MSSTVKLCKRGEIYMADLDPVVGSEQGSRRPVLIIQNDIGNQYSPTTIIAAITSQLSAKIYPTEVRIKAGSGGLDKDSAVLLNQIKTIDKSRLENHFGVLSPAAMKKVDEAIKISLGLRPIS